MEKKWGVLVKSGGVLVKSGGVLVNSGGVLVVGVFWPVIPGIDNTVAFRDEGQTSIQCVGRYIDNTIFMAPVSDVNTL